MNVPWFLVCVCAMYCCVIVLDHVSTLRCLTKLAISMARRNSWSYKVTGVTGRAGLLPQNHWRRRYGPCWTAALESLENGCRQLSGDVQHELALKFVECFLLKTGRPVQPCSDVDKTRVHSPHVARSIQCVHGVCCNLPLTGLR